MFCIDQLEPKWEEFDSHIMVDRERYNSIYSEIETYISDSKDKNRIIMGGSSSISLLLHKPRSTTDFVYYLYSENALSQANELTNLLAKMEQKWVIQLNTKMAYRKYEILVDQRIMVVWYSIVKMSDDSNMFDIIQPITVQSWIDKPIFIIPPHFHLMELYRILYQPQKVDDWQNTLRDEKRIYKYLRETFKDVVGSSDNAVGIINENDNSIVGSADNINKNDLLMTIMKKFIVGNKNVVLIGDIAVDMFEKNQKSRNILGNITCISANPVEDDVNSIKKIVGNAHGLKYVDFSTRDVMVLSDFRLRRTSIRVNKTEIMYIYNAASYELIPFNEITSKKQTIRIGNPFVILRFLLIDIWILLWITSVGKVDRNFSDARVKQYMNTVMKLRKCIETQNHEISMDFVNHSGPLAIFQSRSEEYIGQYDDEQTAQKTAALQTTRYRDYLPQEYIRVHGDYRKI